MFNLKKIELGNFVSLHEIEELQTKTHRKNKTEAEGVE